MAERTSLGTHAPAGAESAHASCGLHRWAFKPFLMRVRFQQRTRGNRRNVVSVNEFCPAVTRRHPDLVSVRMSETRTVTRF
jgi:hypothetical protein